MSCCISVRGFDPGVVDRSQLKAVFGQFGEIRKLYMPPDLTFANISYTSKKEADVAYISMQNSTIGWQVAYEDNRFKYNKPIAESISSSDSMANLDDFENMVINSDYVDIHGRQLDVLKSDLGEIFVPLRELRKTGFALFHKDNYDVVLTETEQIIKEFRIHLLTEARKFLIGNKVTVIGEDEILNTIKRCEDILLGGKSSDILLGTTSNQNANDSFNKRRSITAKNNKITITSTVGASNSHSPPQQHHQVKYPHVQNKPNRVQFPNQDQRNGTIKHNVSASQNANFQREKSVPQLRKPHTKQNQSRSEDIPSLLNESNNKTTQNANNQTQKESLSSNTNNDSRNYNKTSPKQPRNVTSPVTPRSVSSPVQPTTPKAVSSPVQPMPTNNVKIEVLEEVELQIGAPIEITVCGAVENNIYWAQLLTNSEILDELLLKLNDECVNLTNTNAEIGKFVAAQFENVWYRAKVLKTSPDILVRFVDYGNDAEVEVVKTLPDFAKSIPIQGFRIQIENCSKPVDVNAAVNVTCSKRGEDGIYIVNVTDKNKSDKEVRAANKSQDTFEPPVEKAYFNEIKSLKLSNGDQVKILDVDNNILFLRNKQCFDKVKEINEYIPKLDKKPLPHLKVNQLVLCSKDGLPGLYRARVQKVDGSIATMSYIDHSGEETLSAKSLRNIDEFLSTQPACIVRKQLSNMSKIESKAVQHIQTLITSKTKLKVVESDDGKFDLECDGKLLSKIFVNLDEPSSPARTNLERRIENVIRDNDCSITESKTEKITYEDMKFLNVKTGIDSYLCYSFKDLDEITLLAMTDKETSWLTDLTGMDVKDTEPYEPEVFEMCLALYKDEEGTAAWYRGVVVEIRDKDFDVMFVDYGNTETLKSGDLRKFPQYLKEIPILGINCEFVGLPKNNKTIFTKLKELICDGDILEVNIKQIDEQFKCQIEMPVIYNKLRSAGLMD